MVTIIVCSSAWHRGHGKQNRTESNESVKRVEAHWLVGRDRINTMRKNIVRLGAQSDISVAGVLREVEDETMLVRPRYLESSLESSLEENDGVYIGASVLAVCVVAGIAAYIVIRCADYTCSGAARQGAEPPEAEPPRPESNAPRPVGGANEPNVETLGARAVAVAAEEHSPDIALEKSRYP